MHDYPPHRPHDAPADLEQLQPDRADLRPLQFSPGQTHAAKRLHQHVRRRGEQHTELIGQEVMTTEPLAKPPKFSGTPAVATSESMPETG